VFAAAAGTTAVLSLDATVVLLTPVVFATASKLRFSARPHVYSCTHLANSASLLLPVSNLTNLLAFAASGLSFARFGALMVLPWLVAIAIEWVVLSRSFGGELNPPRAEPRVGARGRPPWFALAVLVLTLVGFLLVEPVWAAVAGAAMLAIHARTRPRELVESAEPGFLVFVLGLGVVVRSETRTGRVEREVIAATDGADLLVLARDGERKPGPKSLGPRTRFVVDHATCPLLLV